MENPLLRDGITLDSGPLGRIIFDYELSQFDGTSWTAVEEPVNVQELGFLD